MNTVKTRTLALVAHTDCILDIACGGTNSKLLSLEVNNRKIIPKEHSLLSLSPQKINLLPGLYHLQAQGNVSCTVLGGQCSIVATDGEDPWPVPPAALAISGPSSTSTATPGGTIFDPRDHPTAVQDYFSGLKHPV
jgi:hypothetical protein